MAEQVEDATNGLLSTLSKSDICTVASPGKAFQAEKVWPRPGRSRVGTVPEARGQEAPQGEGRARGAGSRSFSSGVLCSGYLPASSPVVSQLGTPSLSLRGRGAPGVGPGPGPRTWWGPLCLSPPQEEEPSELPRHGQHGATSAGVRSLHC